MTMHEEYHLKPEEYTDRKPTRYTFTLTIDSFDDEDDIVEDLYRVLEDKYPSVTVG